MDEIERLRQWRQAEFLGYKDWLTSWDWEWFVTLTLKDNDDHLTATTLLSDWTRKLCKEEHIQVGYFYIYGEKSRHAHIHALMLGRNASGKTLADVSRSKWERRWPCIAGIQIPESNCDVVRYLALHLFQFKCDIASYNFYNLNLLARCRKPA